MRAIMKTKHTAEFARTDFGMAGRAPRLARATWPGHLIRKGRTTVVGSSDYNHDTTHLHYKRRFGEHILFCIERRKVSDKLDADDESEETKKHIQNNHFSSNFSLRFYY
jgi:hypothetical protein